MPGPNKKPDRRRRNADTQEKQALANARRPELVALDGLRPDPLPTRDFLKPTREWWEDFWDAGELVLGLGEIDVHLVRRLAELKDLYERARRSVRKNPLVEGSQGQPVENPLRRAIATYLGEIRQVEDRLGLSPRARLNLGIQFGYAKRSIEDLLEGSDEDEDGGGNARGNGPQIVEL